MNTNHKLMIGEIKVSDLELIRYLNQQESFFGIWFNPKPKLVYVQCGHEVIITEVETNEDVVIPSCTSLLPGIVLFKLNNMKVTT